MLHSDLTYSRYYRWVYKIYPSDNDNGSPMEQHSKKFSVHHLAKNQHTLLRKLYRNHNSPMRITQQAEVWVVRNPTVVAGVCLSPVADGLWLTSLFTAPETRQQGVASLLVKQVQAFYLGQPIWLFCHPQLDSFYRRLGFKQTQQLPESLRSRLTRYQQHKTLIAMCNHKPNQPANLTLSHSAK